MLAAFIAAAAVGAAANVVPAFPAGGGAFQGIVCVLDNIPFGFGGDTVGVCALDYAVLYDGTRLVMVTADFDGLGNSNAVFVVNDGTDDLSVFGGLSVDGVFDQANCVNGRNFGDANGFMACPMQSDAFPTDMHIHPSDNFPFDAGKPSANLLVRGGDEKRRYSLLDSTQCAGQVVTTTHLDSEKGNQAVVCTEDGTDVDLGWDRGADEVAAAFSLAACFDRNVPLDALNNPLWSASSSDVAVGIQYGPTALKISISGSSACLTNNFPGPNDGIALFSSQLRMNATGGAVILRGTSSPTGPVYIPNSGNLTCGVGGLTDEVSLACDGNEAFKIDSSTATFPLFADFSTDPSITASVTQTQGQQPLISSFNIIDVVANDGDALTMPPAVLGRLVKVTNADSAETAQLFPASGDDLGNGANASVFIPPGDSIEFKGLDVTNWSQTVENCFAIGTDGGFSCIRSTTETLTFAADPGDLDKTTSGLVPDGAYLLGITTRTIIAATNCTSVQIGDGTDDDAYSSATSGITQGTTTTPADFTANLANPQWDGGLDVKITANGGPCFDGSWRVTANYFILTKDLRD